MPVAHVGADTGAAVLRAFMQQFQPDATTRAEFNGPTVFAFALSGGAVQAALKPGFDLVDIIARHRQRIYPLG